jgi:hypothetical protein
MTIKEKKEEDGECSRNEGGRQNEWPVNSTVYEREREKNIETQKNELLIPSTGKREER